MSKNLSRQVEARKKAVLARGGIVAAQNQMAADVGAGALTAGGNAIDAAIATAFALAALEPWMSGLGGVGQMIVWDARQRRCHTVDFGPISARHLDPGDYPLTGRVGGDLFGWPQVLDDRNLVGHSAIAVPSQPDGMRVAHAHFATKPWAELLAPAIALAGEGIEADWFATVIIATAAAALSRFPASRAWFLPGGLPPAPDWDWSLPRLKNPALAATLKALAERGPRDIYEGALASALVADLAAGGSRIDAGDVANYRARVVEPLEFNHAGRRFAAAPGLTAGPTLRDALSRIAGRIDHDGPEIFPAYADALAAASAARLETMGESRTAAECTTHLSVIDRDGNMVALTQTLLSVFGSKVVLPETGILMNNAINWFDPRPGRPNSLGPGKRPLTNMLPLLGFADDAPWLAIGGSGGRRILPAILQLISFQTDLGLGLEAAFGHMRIDTSVAGEVAVDPELAPQIRAELAKRFKVVERRRVPYPLGYACPVAAAIEDGGERVAMTEWSQPWAGAAAG